MPSSDSSATRGSSPSFHGGLDVATLLGVALVTIEHYLVLIDRPVQFPDEQLILGSIGVFLFLLLSGIHARESAHPPLAWLMRRLTRIYPAFWIVLSVAFLTAWITGVRSFDAAQVLAQLSGFGFFLYGDSLILQPTWFLSPLLVCYLAVFCIRSAGPSRLLSLLALFGCALGAWWFPSEWTSLTLFAFFIGYCLAGGRSLRDRVIAMLIVGIAIIALFPLNSHGSKVGMACLLAAAGLAYRGEIPGIRRFAERSYEFYLVHGLAFFGALRYLRMDPVTGGITGLIGSLVLAEALYQLVRGLRRLVGKIAAPPSASGLEASRMPAAP